MPANAQVTLCYGPYESSGVVQHRTFRLQGLQAALRARGHRCILEETCDWNMVELVVRGEVVFRCKIKELEFGEFGKAETKCYIRAKSLSLPTCCVVLQKVEMENWILYAGKPLLQWKALTEDNRTCLPNEK